MYPLRTMKTVTYRLVTIVAERSVRDRLLTSIHQLGATGHTLYDVKGEGTRHAGFSREAASVKIEVVVSPEVAEKVVDHVAEKYFAHHSVIVYVQDVEVVRGSKYGPHNEEA